MSSAQDIAKQAGLNPVNCGKCNNKIMTKDAMDAFFKILLQEVKDGGRVLIPGLGTFSTRLMKGRTVNSPVLPTGTMVFQDQYILRFRPSEIVRRVLNPDVHGDGEEQPKPKTSKPKTSKKSSIYF